MKKILFLISALSISAMALAQKISEKEKATIIQMREEEKMARDVYKTFSKKWNHQVFRNISESETYHFNRVKVLLDAFNLKDPVEINNDKQGVFENRRLQNLYNELINSGNTNLESALRAGAKIEEVDINDLKKAINETNHSTVINTYQYLLRASENHLRAFVKNLNRMGIKYKPVVLNETDFNNIIKKYLKGNSGRSGSKNQNRIQSD